MKDPLKDFIQNNRQAFDDKEPSKRVWKGISDSLQSRTMWDSLVVWRIAAAVFLCLSVYLLLNKNPSIEKKKEVARLQIEFKDLESFYSTQIAEKAAMISSLDSGGENQQFTNDFQKLDAMYQVLNEEMKTRPTEKVKDALILNLLVRIDLLNQQLKKLEDSRKLAKEQKAAEV